LFDPSLLWESLDRIYEEGLNVGWLTSIGHVGEVFVTAKERIRELNSGPFLGAKSRFLFFSKTHSRTVTGLLTAHNTLFTIVPYTTDSKNVTDSREFQWKRDGGCGSEFCRQSL
jgi:hypothetical protein